MMSWWQKFGRLRIVISMLMAVWEERLSQPSAGHAKIAVVRPFSGGWRDATASDTGPHRTRLFRKVPVVSPLCGPPGRHDGAYGGCAPLEWNIAVSSWRWSAAATSRARPWSRQWCGKTRKRGNPSPPSAKQLYKQKRGRSTSGSCMLPSHAPAASGWDVRCVKHRAMISGRRRRRLTNGEQRVTWRPIRTKPMLTSRCVPRAPQGAVSTHSRGPIPGQLSARAARTIQMRFRVPGNWGNWWVGV